MVLLISSERIELESCARIKAFDEGNWWLYPDDAGNLSERGRSAANLSSDGGGFCSFFSPFLGSGPGGNQRRQSPVEYRGNPSVRMSVRPYIRPTSVPPLRPIRGWPRTLGTDGRMYVRTDGQTGGTDSPCILQDFVSSGSLRVHCPKSSSLGLEEAGFRPSKACLSHMEAVLGHSGSLNPFKGPSLYGLST